MNKSILFILCFISIAGVFLSPETHAQTLSETREKLAAQKESAAQKAREKKQAEARLQDIKDQLVNTARTMQELELTINDLQDRQEKLAEQQALLIKNLSQDSGLSASLILAVYRAERLPPYGLYFSKAPKEETINRMIALKSTFPALQKRMKSYETEIDKIDNLQKDMAGLILKNRQKRDKLDTENDRLNTLVQKRQDLYRSVSAAYSHSTQEIKRLQKEAKNIESLMARIKPAPRPDALSGPSFSAKGLPSPPPRGSNNPALPVVGEVKIGYGEKDEIGGISNGLIYTTQPRTTVVSPKSGTVVFAGPFQKYKRLLIIEHNGGYHSLIAGLDRIDVQTGIQLQAGEPVGRILRSDGQAGRLYYEVRKKGQPVDPKIILKTKHG